MFGPTWFELCSTLNFSSFFLETGLRARATAEIDMMWRGIPHKASFNATSHCIALFIQSWVHPGLYRSIVSPDWSLFVWQWVHESVITPSHCWSAAKSGRIIPPPPPSERRCPGPDGIEDDKQSPPPPFLPPLFLFPLRKRPWGCQDGGPKADVAAWERNGRRKRNVTCCQREQGGRKRKEETGSRRWKKKGTLTYLGQETRMQQTAYRHLRVIINPCVHCILRTYITPIHIYIVMESISSTFNFYLHTRNVDTINWIKYSREHS